MWRLDSANAQEMATFLGCEYHISTVICPVPIKRWPQLPEKDYPESIEVTPLGNELGRGLMGVS